MEGHKCWLISVSLMRCFFFPQTFQELEEERIAFMRNTMWKVTNVGSSVSVQEDEVGLHVRVCVHVCVFVCVRACVCVSAHAHVLMHTVLCSTDSHPRSGVENAAHLRYTLHTCYVPTSYCTCAGYCPLLQQTPNTTVSEYTIYGVLIRVTQLAILMFEVMLTLEKQ